MREVTVRKRIPEHGHSHSRAAVLRRKVEIIKATQGNDFYRVIHREADKMRTTVRREFLAAIKRVKSTTALSSLADAIQRGKIDEVVRALNIDPRMTGSLESSIVQPLRGVMVATGMAASKVLPGKPFATIRGRFDMLNPRVTEFINQYDFNLVSGITRRTAEGIRTVIRDAFEFGGHPMEQAEYIKDLIGLTSNQANAVRNLRRSLEAAGHSREFVRQQASDYADKLLDQRAYNIARTETIRAANVGQESLWQQALDEGLLIAKNTRRIWIVTPDDALCPLCESIPDDNPDGVALEDDFDSSEGAIDGPPAHPQCRCAQGLQFV